jgi:alpha-beta hydrolase superfamily lysophospholipase
MKHAPPPKPELGRRDGLSYALYLPPDEPKGGVVILHGAGSAKESHLDFGRVCRERGLAALAYDAPGHGRSDGEWGPRAVDDALAMCALVREHAPAVALRGSSMGGLTALLAAARDPDLAAVVAICPAPEELLLRGLRSDRIGTDFRVDRAAAEPWLQSSSVYEAVTDLGPSTALLLLHARGDEQVPYVVSEDLHAAAHEPKRLIVFPGGHHRSLQHDLEVQNLSVKWIEKAIPLPPP